MDVKGKIAVITGAASGIGRATALKFHAEGAAGIVVADMNEAGLQPVAQAVNVSHPSVFCFQLPPPQRSLPKLLGMACSLMLSVGWLQSVLHRSCCQSTRVRLQQATLGWVSFLFCGICCTAAPLPNGAPKIHSIVHAYPAHGGGGCTN